MFLTTKNGGSDMYSIGSLPSPYTSCIGLLRLTQTAEQLAATGNAVIVIPGGGVAQIGARGPDGSIHGPSAHCGPAGQCVQYGR